MNISEAKKYFQQHENAKLVVVPRRYKYVMQIQDNEFVKTIKSKITGSDIACDTLGQINDYAKKLNKFDYQLIQNCPHVEMSGLDNENQKVAHRTDATNIRI